MEHLRLETPTSGTWPEFLAGNHGWTGAKGRDLGGVRGRQKYPSDRCCFPKNPRNFQQSSPVHDPPRENEQSQPGALGHGHGGRRLRAPRARGPLRSLPRAPQRGDEPVPIASLPPSPGTQAGHPRAWSSAVGMERERGTGDVPARREPPPHLPAPPRRAQNFPGAAPSPTPAAGRL